MNIDVNKVVQQLSQRIAQLEVEKAVLQSQLDFYKKQKGADDNGKSVRKPSGKQQDQG